MEKLKEELSDLWENLEKVPFYPHYVTNSFGTTSEFSKLDVRLALHNKGLSTVAYRAIDLFKEVEELEVHEEALRFIINSRKKCWPPADLQKSKSEREIFLEVCSKILVPLCRHNEVVLEKGYERFLREGQYAELRCSHLGMGTNQIWHGFPDARIRGSEVQRWSDSDECDDEDSDSDGATTTVEGKVSLRFTCMQQVVGICTISAFIEKNLHNVPLVPTILIDSARFRVCLYDCEKDVLLISGPNTLATENCLSPFGMLLLWLVINHR